MRSTLAIGSILSRLKRPVAVDSNFQSGASIRGRKSIGCAVGDLGGRNCSNDGERMDLGEMDKTIEGDSSIGMLIAIMARENRVDPRTSCRLLHNEYITTDLEMKLKM